MSKNFDKEKVVESKKEIQLKDIFTNQINAQQYKSQQEYKDIENQFRQRQQSPSVYVNDDLDLHHNQKQPRMEYDECFVNDSEEDIEQRKKKQTEEFPSSINDGDNLRFDDMDYKQNKSIISQFFFLNLYTMVMKLKKVFNKKLILQLHHLPKLNIKYQVKNNTDIFYDKLEKMRNGNMDILPTRVFRVLMGCYRFDIFCVLILSLLDVFFKLFNSISLNYCIESIIDGRISDAYAWAGGLIASLFFSCIFRHQSWTFGQNLNSKFRLVLVNTIYRKINKLSSHSIREANLGKIINLISSDLNSTESKFYFLFQLILAPLTLTLGCIILAFRLGPLGLISVAMLLFIFPLQQIFGRMASKHIQSRIQKSDERIKLINEAIDGIRLIKMYGWEKAFGQMVENIRGQEIRSNMNAQTLQYIEKSISTTCVLVIAAITFIVIHYEGSYSLDSAKIFSTIEMLQFMKLSVMMFSGTGIGYIYELKIFMKRFIDIFQIKESEMVGIIDLHANYNFITDDEVIKFDKFNAFWKARQFSYPQQKIQRQRSSNLQVNIMTTTDEHDQINKLQDSQQLQDARPTLKNISLSIKKGDLLAVVGKIGSGKTTLLQCLLKEIPYYEGYYETKYQDNDNSQHLAYVEQEPYIFSKTVRQNILFGKPYDEKWYNKVVKQCCLLPDFKEMEKGDQTEIGEKGINISGGQKTRISLARAIYSNAEVYLLDDPLSAVDSKVAKKLFKKCIKGLLKDKTVILVTHQIHFTKYCDRIVILEEGSIKNEGKFEKMEEHLKKLAAGVLKFENQKEQAKSKQSSHNGQLKEVNIKKEDKNQQPENKLKKKLIRDEIKVSISTYSRYLKIISKIIFGFPLWLILFIIIAECTFTAFNRSLGFYDTTSDDSKQILFAFWIGLSCLYMLMNCVKYIFFAMGNQFKFSDLKILIEWLQDMT